MEPDEILMDAEERMGKALETFQKSLGGLRTGRATPGLVDSIRVDYYGSPTPLKQIATISVPEPQQIVIKPFDGNVINEIAKAIVAGDIGLSPNNDGRVIRLNIPALSTERRKQLVSRLKELAEDARIAIRNVRRDANKHIDQAEKDKTLSEDDAKRYKDDIQELTKKFESKVNDQAATKETEVMEE